MKKNVTSTLSSRTMMWGGLALLLFIIFHILQFTTLTIEVGGSFDSPHERLVAAFETWWLVAIYVVAMIALGMHLVLGTQRSAWKLERARSLGLDVAICVGEQEDTAEGEDTAEREDFAERVIRETGAARDRSGVDTILDLVGGDYLAGNLRAVRVLGRIAVVGLVAGAKSELDMRLLLQKRATVIGTVLRARSLVEKIEAVRAFERQRARARKCGARIRVGVGSSRAWPD